MKERRKKRWGDVAASTTIAGSIIFIIDFLGFLRFSPIYVIAFFLGAAVVVYVLVTSFRGQGWGRLAMVLGSVVFGLCLAEILFLLLIVKPFVPVTDTEFHSAISSAWPRPIEESRNDEEKIRIMGLADSFGRSGGHQNYHFLIEELAAESGEWLEVVNLSWGRTSCPMSYSYFNGSVNVMGLISCYTGSL